MRFLIALAMLLSASAHAVEPVFDLLFPNPVKISELSKIVYGEMLEQNYIIEPALLKDEATVSTGLRSLTKKTVDQAFRALLDSQGYAVTKRAGVIFIGKKPEETQQEKPEEKKELFVYAPKYRSSTYLTGILATMFEGFQGKRALGGDANQTGQPAGQPIAQPVPAEKKDKGVNALFNKDSDLVIFEGTQADIDRLQRALVQIDVAQMDVVVKGVVYEVSTDKKEGSAVGLAMSILNGKIGVSGGNMRDLGNAAKIALTGGINLEAVYSAFSQDNRFKNISSPTVRVRSGDSAYLEAGASVPIRGESSFDRNGNQVASVKYQPSGIIFDIRPTVRQEVIELVINQQISNFTATTTSGIDSPTLNKRQATTTISAQPGELLVLGGLEESRSANDDSGLPFLPRFLRTTGSQDSKTEILLVLQVQKL